ncbi:uncharacterized protein V6R79_008136 [Siganus canaliculatus]
MRKMLVLCLMSSVIKCQQPKRYSAQEGDQVQISCPYNPGYESSTKQFYKGLYSEMKRLQIGGKYHLRDDTKQRIMYVTIRDLNLSDGGTYWCYINTNTFDPKTEIELTVTKKAPAPLKPALVATNPPVSTTTQVFTEYQQPLQITTVSESSSTTLQPAPLEETHKELPAFMGNKLYLTVAVVFLLLILFVVFFLQLRKHKHDAKREFECDPWMNTSRQDELREVDPPVSASSPDCLYATVIKGPGAHSPVSHPASTRTSRGNVIYDTSTSSCLRDDDSAFLCGKHVICSSRKSSEAEDQRHTEDLHLLYSTVHFNREGAAHRREQTCSTAASTLIYATVRRPET